LVPEPIVDLSIQMQVAGRERQVEVAQRGAEGRALGPPEVEEGLVEIEEDRAERQDSTWRGR
jgi:hypothetical protein